jgi:hypothetical protein
MLFLRDARTREDLSVSHEYHPGGDPNYRHNPSFVRALFYALTSPRPVSKYLQRKHSLFTLSLRARVDLDQQITR